MAKSKNEIIKEADVEIKYYTKEENEIFESIAQEMWESDRATELSYAREEGLKMGIEKRHRKTA